MIFRFNKKYFVLFTIILIIETLIALYIRDNIIRPFLGDILVVILIYFFIKSFFYIKTKLLPLYIFIFASLIEITQYFHIVDLFNIKNKALRIIFGNTFDIKDIVCYFLGASVLLLYQYIKLLKNKKAEND